MERLKKRVEELEGQLEDSQKECSEEKTKVGNLESEKKKLEQENSSFQKNLEQAQASAEDWEGQYKSLELTNEMLKADIQVAEDAKNEIMESLPEEKTEYLAEFLKSEAFARASLVASQNTVEQTLYWAVKEIGAVKVRLVRAGR